MDFINYKDAIVRIFVVFSVVWVIGSGFILKDRITATKGDVNFYTNPFAPMTRDDEALWLKRGPPDWTVRSQAGAIIIGGPLATALGILAILWILAAFPQKSDPH